MGILNWLGGMMNDGEEAAAAADPDEGFEDVALGAEEPGGPAAGEEGPDLVELEHQVGELEEGIERNASRIESVQHSQEEVAERVEEMDEIVRDLLGVYDRLTSDVNPFEDDAGDAVDAGRFGVVNGNGEHADGSTERPGAADAHDDPEPGAGADDPAPGAGPEDLAVEAQADVVTFDDVVAGLDEPADPEPSGSERSPPAAETEGDAGADGTGATGAAEVGATANGRAGRTAPDRTDRAGSDRAAPGAERTPYLTALPDSYAADALVFQWLGELVETAGPAAALKAVSYYEDVDWIGPSVSAALEEYLGGPGIDVYVDPNEPDDLTAEDHATSYEYILKLDAIRELEHTA